MKSSTRPATSIGDVAAHFGLATHVLRHWESVGLLTPERDAAGRRRYDDDDVFRIAMILRAKEAGLGLDDIHAMFTTGERTTVLQRHRRELRARIAEAQAALAIIERGLACDHGDFMTCPKFRASVSELLERRGNAVSWSAGPAVQPGSDAG
ncbi:MerR family transcriptional regulator [Nocardia altamirensis]|uniref:MerR family transcriptional regulator n=1 Tax=Nocardia altamirensis TaxID=472158 RepID=UPI00084045DE|nr:MerR family transcriptional regulator [Nocardia altamirensis]